MNIFDIMFLADSAQDAINSYPDQLNSVYNTFYSYGRVFLFLSSFAGIIALLIRR